MKRFFILFFLLFSSNAFAQNIYLDSLKNAFSGTFAMSLSDDFNSYGYGASYTINGSVSVGLIYITGNQSIDNTDIDISASGFGAYASFALLNELRDAPVGLNLGLSYQSTDFDSDDSNELYSTTSLGVGLNFSKKSIADEGDTGAFIIQAGLTAFPISEIEFIEGEFFQGTTVDPYVAGNFAFTFLFGTKSSFKLAAEPGVSYNFKHDIASFSVSVTAIF